MTLTRILGLSLVALLTSGPIWAQVPAPDSITRIPAPLSASKPATAAEEAMVAYLRDRASPGDVIDTLEKAIRTEHSQWLDLQQANRPDEAVAARRNILSSLLRDDINGDGRVTRKELTVAGRFRAARSKETESSLSPSDYASARLAEGDVDGDGALTRADAEALSPSRRAMANASPLPRVDPDDDGTMDNAELATALRRAFQWLDQDRDGRLSNPELIIQQAAQDAPVLSACNLPDIPQDHDIIGLHGRSGTGFIDLEFSAEPDEAVQMAELVIPRGTRPIWIAARFDSPMVLRLAGASERVAGLLSLKATTALTGHPGAMRVVTPDCQDADILGILSSRPGATLFRADRFGRLTVQTGQNAMSYLFEGDDTPDAEGPARHTRLALYHFSPGGFHRIAPTELAVPPGITATPRDLWPYEAGLLQLIENGDILPVTTATSGVLHRLAPGSPIPVRVSQSAQFAADGWIFTKTEDGGWIGRERLTFYALGSAPELPVGLSGVRRIVLATTN